MINDFQKISKRINDPIIKKIDILNKKDKSIIHFLKSIIEIRKLLLSKGFNKKEINAILKNFTKIFLFKKFIIKNKGIETLIEKNNVPQEIIDELETYLKIDKEKVKDEIFRQDNIKPRRKSKLDLWIRYFFLKKVKKYLRGVYGYKVHARYASNDGKLKSSKRFQYSFSNMHWDFALNAMPFVIYLSDVKKGQGEFKVLNHPKNFKQNLYLSFYDYLISENVGISKSLMSNRVGSHLEVKDKKDIENNITYFDGPKGTSIFFAGRYILHCGGYPDLNQKRLSIFLSHKNIYMSMINTLLNIFFIF